MAATEQARCRQYDPELWFPIGNGATHDRQAADAKAICATCPLIVPCLEYALDTGDDWGVWGGTTPAERRRMRRAHPITTRRTPDGTDASRAPLVRQLASTV